VDLPEYVTKDCCIPRWLDRAIYDPNADIAKLAAVYGFGLAKNHAFVDGNKRIAFIATALFLRLNGWRLASNRTVRRNSVRVESCERRNYGRTVCRLDSREL